MFRTEPSRHDLSRLARERRTPTEHRSRRRGGMVLLALLTALSLVALPFAQRTFAARPHVIATLNVGYKDFAEEEIMGDMYALLLEKAGFAVHLKMLAETPLLQSAMQRGDLDLYPEYTGTGLVVLGINKPITGAVKAYDIVKTRYERKYHFTWLEQTPMNDTNGVGVTQATAAKYRLHTLSDLAKVSSQLSFADDPACPTRFDCLAGMTKHYGIHFKSVTGISSTPLRYKGLMSGQYNVIQVFTTDAPIKVDHVVVLKDNKHAVFPADHIAPIVRDPVLKKYPQVKMALNSMARYVTTKAMIRLNGMVLLQNMKPMDVAHAFLRSKGLI